MGLFNLDNIHTHFKAESMRSKELLREQATNLSGGAVGDDQTSAWSECPDRVARMSANLSVTTRVAKYATSCAKRDRGADDVVDMVLANLLDEARKRTTSSRTNILNAYITAAWAEAYATLVNMREGMYR
jgi:hypothetical protein